VSKNKDFLANKGELNKLLSDNRAALLGNAELQFNHLVDQEGKVIIHCLDLEILAVPVNQLHVLTGVQGPHQLQNQLQHQLQNQLQHQPQNQLQNQLQLQLQQLQLQLHQLLQREPLIH
jgi:hypothetical protein